MKIDGFHDRQGKSARSRGCAGPERQRGLSQLDLDLTPARDLDLHGLRQDLADSVWRGCGDGADRREGRTDIGSCRATFRGSTFELSRYMGASLTMIDRHCAGWLSRTRRSVEAP